jgi:stage V sporulation protein B
LPIIASTLIQSVSVFAYNSAVQFCLSLADFNALRQEFADCLSVNSTPDEDVTTYIYGLFSTAQDFKNIVPGFTMALGVAAVPALSAAFEDSDKSRLSVLANSIFKYTAILSIGGGAYLSLVAENLLALFYQNSNYDIVLGCTGLIKFMGFTMLLYSLSGTAVFAVQAIGCASKSIPALIASGILRVFLCAALVSNARYNIFGAAVADAAAYLIILISNLYIFGKYSGIKYQFSQMLLKPALCSLAAFFGSRMIFSALFDFQGNLLKFLVFSTVFGVIFTAGLILSKTIKFSEFKILQYG